MIETTKIVEALRCQSPVCPCYKNGTNKHLLHCPAHDDAHPSLSLSNGSDKFLVHCHAGCSTESVINVLKSRGLWVNANPSEKGVTVLHPSWGLTLEQIAAAKKLPIQYLRSLGVSDIKQNGTPAVKVPYYGEDGRKVTTRYRRSLGIGSGRFTWQKGARVMLYGLDHLNDIRKVGWVLLVEGESDCWTLWHHDLPALGIPGKATWQAKWAGYLTGLDVFLWQEPGAGDLVDRLQRSVAVFKVINPPSGIKDPSEAFVTGHNLPELVNQLKAQAIPIETILRDQCAAQTSALQQEAILILASEDPLKLIEEEITRLGYGGDIKPAMIVYLAATSRVLAMRQGGMPVHLILLGDPSGGKSWTVGVVLRLLPADSYHKIDAGSPRVLIYDQSDLKHRALLFAEADSLPTSEDNPASSALRGLLQEGRLIYDVVERDPETGEHSVRHIDKPGPTALITTAIKPLPSQLMSRLFALEMPDDPAQVRAALNTQARLELLGTPEACIPLVKFQSLLQARAPWDVIVPFAERLAIEIGKSNNASRIMRDYARLLSLIKTVAVLRHGRRKTDDSGRLVAEIEDYVLVKGLVDDMFSESVSGATSRTRQIVQMVSAMVEERDASHQFERITVTMIAKRLGINKTSVSRAVKRARANGWLVNNEDRRGHPANLAIGEPLPDQSGLPMPGDVA